MTKGKTFGAQVREMRRKAGLTQAALAQKMKITQGRIAVVEGKGSAQVTAALLKRAAKACGIDMKIRVLIERV